MAFCIAWPSVSHSEQRPPGEAAGGHTTDGDVQQIPPLHGASSFFSTSRRTCSNLTRVSYTYAFVFMYVCFCVILITRNHTYIYICTYGCCPKFFVPKMATFTRKKFLSRNFRGTIAVHDSSPNADFREAHADLSRNFRKKLRYNPGFPTSATHDGSHSLRSWVTLNSREKKNSFRGTIAKLSRSPLYP